jgi:chloride channel protein, CIC family
MGNVAKINELYKRLSEKLAISENAFLIGISFVVGISTGLGAAIFRWLIMESRQIFFGHNILWLIPIVPMIGGLIVGPIVYFYAREAKGHGVPEVMAAVALKSGVIRPRVAVAKAIASAICIGSGGSAGREGPIVQIGAAIGSTIGQALHLSGERIKVLVGCGAAAGIAAVFNAPIAGMFFALEVILGDFAIGTFAPVILSATLSSVISRAIFLDKPAFVVAPYNLVSGLEIPLYIILGIFCGIIAFLFIRSLYIVEDIFEERLKIPGYLKPALGGLFLGLLGLFTVKTGLTVLSSTSPPVFSDGYETVTAALHNQGLWSILLALSFLKIVATDLTLGSGNSGGIFAPSLFMGAMAGSSFGIAVHSLFPTLTASSGAYALVGMAAVVAGTTHATITSILIVFEMTGDYKIVLALMIACVFATLVSKRLSPESIYTLKLARRGIKLSGGKDITLLDNLKARDVMRTDIRGIPISTELRQIYRYFEESDLNAVPVLNVDGSLYGIIYLKDLKSVLAKHEADNLIIASDIASHVTVTIGADENLNAAFRAFGIRDDEIIPVVAKGDPGIIKGFIYRIDLINHYNKMLDERSSRMKNI